MKRVSTVLAVLTALLVAVPAFSQSAYIPSASYDVGVFNAPNYAQYQVRVVTGNTTANAAGSLVVSSGAITLPDGRVITPFSTSVPLLIDIGANQETATPSSVSGCTLASNQPAPAATCTLTFSSLTNVHGQGALVQSGDQGIMEAIQDAGNQGGGLVYFQADTGNLVLSTSGATTTAAQQVPTAFISMGGSCRTTTTVTTATSYSLGLSGTTTAFVNTDTNITAGQISTMSFLNAPTKVGTTIGSGVTPLIVTAQATPGAGAVHCKAWGYVPVQASF